MSLRLVSLGLSRSQPGAGRPEPPRQPIRSVFDAIDACPHAERAACLDAARALASHLAAQDEARRCEIADMAAMVRDAVATFAGGQADVHRALSGSADRVERLAACDDPRDLRRLLVTEVAALRQLALEQRAAWERIKGGLEDRVASLECQLESTRRDAEGDALTGILNRRAFARVGGEWLEPSHAGFVLAVIDVDDFKAVNDRFGHLMGDRVLVAIAETLTRSVRVGDIVARIGGDEFALLAAGLSLAQAERRFASVVHAVEAACQPLLPDGPAVSVSIGIAERSAGDTAESLRERADAALYRAKRNGKGHVASLPTPFIRDLLRRGAPGR